MSARTEFELPVITPFTHKLYTVHVLPCCFVCNALPRSTSTHVATAQHHEEEEFVLPFDAQAAATSARVPRTGIVVPLRRKRTGCGRGGVHSRALFFSFLWQCRSDVQASGGCQHDVKYFHATCYE